MSFSFSLWEILCLTPSLLYNATTIHLFPSSIYFFLRFLSFPIHCVECLAHLVANYAPYHYHNPFPSNLHPSLLSFCLHLTSHTHSATTPVSYIQPHACLRHYRHPLSPEQMPLWPFPFGPSFSSSLLLILDVNALSAQPHACLHHYHHLFSLIDVSLFRHHTLHTRKLEGNQLSSLTTHLPHSFLVPLLHSWFAEINPLKSESKWSRSAWRYLIGVRK